MRNLFLQQAAALTFIASTAFGAQLTPVTNADIPVDNHKGRFVNFETAHVQPMVLFGSPLRLFAINAPGGRLEVFDTNGTRKDGIRIGLGAVSVVVRPGAQQLWLVDSVSSTVFVIDPRYGSILRTIRVGAEPHGLAFSDSIDRAYVTCTAANEVDVIDVASYSVVKKIAIPAKAPRGIVYHGGAAYVTCLVSGNNTAPMGTSENPQAVAQVATVEGPFVLPLPDRDLFVIRSQAQPQNDFLDLPATVSGLGTILFNLHLRPGTNELWIPNTEALNAVFKGEKSFIEGQVVSNRITIVDATGSTPPRIIDLDQLSPAGKKCAQPSYVAFDPVHQRAFVCGYGSDRIAVLDVAGPQPSWLGSILLPAKQEYPRGTGPRGCLVDAAGEKLYVFNKIDNSLTVVNLAALPAAPFDVVAGIPQSLGFNPTSTEEWLGRHLFTNARFSKSQTSSCASCHVDGHTDGLVWDLSSFLDPEGTPNDQLTFGVDVKGPLVTQSVRRMEESGPFHWRGERSHIDNFSPTFVDLLQNEVNGTPEEIGPDFQYMRHYINRLPYQANPRQELDRKYTAEQLEGASIFMTKPVLGALTCTSCHALPLGTSGELVPQVTAGVLTSADVPQLRGVGDKLSPSLLIGGLFGRRSELGAGLTHGGAFPTIGSVALQKDPEHPGQPMFDVSPSEAAKIEKFLLAFDTGLAPSTGFAVTAHAGNQASVSNNELAFLRSEAELGNCDLMFVCSPTLAQGLFVYQTGVYNPATHKFRSATASQPEFDEQPLLQLAAAGKPVTFIGVPLGMGSSQALDRDNDALLDADERALGTNPDAWDTDGDKFPDGYELAWGMDPFSFNTSSPDTQAPSLSGPAKLIYKTTNTIKIEVKTDEFCRIQVSYNGGYPVQRLPLSPHSDTEFSIVINDLKPDTDYTINLNLADAAGNKRDDASTVIRTRALSLPVPARIENIALSIVTSPTSEKFLLGKVTMKAGSLPADANYGVAAAVYHVAVNGTLTMIADEGHTTLAPTGVGTIRFPLPAPGSLAPGMLIFVVKDVTPPAGSVPYALGLNKMTKASIAY